MVKIPAPTRYPPRSIKCLYIWHHITVTLLFSVDATPRWRTRPQGARAARAEGKDMTRKSVASFFVSRVDTEVDKRLRGVRPHRPPWDRRDRQRAPPAYQRSRHFDGSAWQKRPMGAAVVFGSARFLASTGTKTPAYPETKYVDTLRSARTTGHTIPDADELNAAAEQKRGDRSNRHDQTHKELGRSAMPASTSTT